MSYHALEQTAGLCRFERPQIHAKINQTQTRHAIINFRFSSRHH